MKEPLKEWSVSVPWGKIILISWGNPSGCPILLVHGRQDSAATFIPLLGLLPSDYYYVAVDLPGHGKSDPFPIGLTLSKFDFVTAVDMVVKHLGWKKFIYMSHSMGGHVGLFYNAIRPNRITKFVHLDVGIALQTIVFQPFPEFYTMYYENYYDNYNKINIDDRVYTKQMAVNAVRNARGLTEEQAEIVLSRNLHKIGEDKYRLSWDKRLKSLAHLNLPNEYALQIYTTNIPPTLFITATQSEISYENREAAILVKEMKNKLKNFEHIIVEGSHDVHLTNPERVSEYIVEFLKKEFVSSKL